MFDRSIIGYVKGRFIMSEWEAYLVCGYREGKISSLPAMMYDREWVEWGTHTIAKDIPFADSIANKIDGQEVLSAINAITNMNLSTVPDLSALEGAFTTQDVVMALSAHFDDPENWGRIGKPNIKDILRRDNIQKYSELAKERSKNGWKPLYGLKNV